MEGIGAVGDGGVGDGGRIGGPPWGGGRQPGLIVKVTKYTR